MTTRTLDVINPRTGEADHRITPLDRDQLAEVCARLRAAQPAWAARSPEERGKVLTALAGAMTARRTALIEALARDTGRMGIAQVEFQGAIGFLQRWAADAPAVIARAGWQTRPSAIPGIETVGQLVPYPLVGAITPWNFPLILSLIDVVPALAAGCAVVIKPSEVTPRFMGPLQEAIDAVPEIAAVLALVEGDGATGAALVELVDFVAFTGSVATGRKVAEGAARAFIPACLELGGKDPMIILESADPATAAGIALRASVAATGQACQSIERVYVQRGIAEPFLAALVEQAGKAELNHPEITSGHIGPFIFQKQATIVQDQLDDAVARGATVLAGGQVETLGGGKYLRPTVLTGVTRDMKLMREETFGPVIPVTLFDTVDEAVAMANDTSYGLSAAVIAGTTDEAEAVADRLNAGAVSINDGSLTAMVWDAEHDSFGLSGMGPARMGDSGLTRYFRKRAILRQTGQAAPLAAYTERANA